MPFFDIINNPANAIVAPTEMINAWKSPNWLKTTPARMIGKTTSPPPRIATGTLIFLFFDFDFLVPDCFISSFCFLFRYGTKNPEKTLTF